MRRVASTAPVRRSRKGRTLSLCGTVTFPPSPGQRQRAQHAPALGGRHPPRREHRVSPIGPERGVVDCRRQTVRHRIAQHRVRRRTRFLRSRPGARRRDPVQDGLHQTRQLVEDGTVGPVRPPERVFDVAALPRRFGQGAAPIPTPELPRPPEVESVHAENQIRRGHDLFRERHASVPVEGQTRFGGHPARPLAGTRPRVRRNAGRAHGHTRDRPFGDGPARDRLRHR